MHTERKTFSVFQTHIRYGKKYYSVHYEGRDYYVRLFPFQEAQVDPDEIHCLITTDDAGCVRITQNIQPYLDKMYTRDEEYEFRVRSVYADHAYSEVEDSAGFFFRLYTERSLLVGQRVTCRVAEIGGGKMKLELTDATVSEAEEKEQLPEPDLALTESVLAHTLSEACPHDLPADAIASMSRLILGNDEPFDRRAGKWLSLLLQDEAKHSLHSPTSSEDAAFGPVSLQSRRSDLLQAIRTAVLHVLQSSDALAGCDPQRRSLLQERLTQFAEQCEFYSRAAALIDEGRHAAFIEALFANLRTSHYLYHAAEQLEVMMCVFTFLPELLEAQMDSFLSIITAAEESAWKTATFRRAFIRLLDYYVSEQYDAVSTTHDVEDPNFCNVFKALSIQLHLADPEHDADLFDAALSHARLYRMAACFRTGNADALLHKSLLSLADVLADPVGKAYAWADVPHLPLVAARLSESVETGMLPDFEKSFVDEVPRLTVSSSALTLCPAGTSEGVHPVIPDVEHLWGGLQVLSDDKCDWISSPDALLIDAHRLWNDIERSARGREQAPREAKRKMRPSVYEDKYKKTRLYIAPYAVDPKHADRFLCRIDDEKYEGEGYLSFNEIALFRLSELNGKEPFRTPDGEQICVEADILDEDTGTGMFVFSTKGVFQERLKEEASAGDEFCCVLTDHNQNTGDWIGYAENGLGVKFINGDTVNEQRILALQENGEYKGGDALNRGNVLKAKLLETSSSGNVLVEILDGVYGRNINQVDTVVQLARELGAPCLDADKEADETKVVVAGTLFTPEQIDELTLLFDQVACREHGRVRRYHYVSAARLMALMAHREQRTAFYDKWRDLLEMLDYYAVNRTFDDAQKQRIEDYYAHYTPADGHLIELIEILRVLSRFDTSAGETTLLECTREGSTERVRKLAAMVLAANLLDTGDLEAAHASIRARVDEILLIGRETKQPIGREDIATEFKTSVVFPPELHMRPDIDRQTHNILRVLCAFYNTKGGTLYLGVNDHGIPVGLEEDFNFVKFSGKSTADTLDAYMRHIRDVVRRAFGSLYTSEHYLTVSHSLHYDKDVVEVRVLRPADELLRLDGEVYERQGSECVKLDGSQLREFEQLRKRRMERERAAEAAPEVAVPSVPSSTPQPKTAGNDAPKHERTKVHMPSAKIATATLRNNVLHDYEDDYLSPERFLIFSDDHTAQLRSDYYGAEEGELLALALHENERSWLVLGYADGAVVRVRLSNIVDKRDYDKMQCYSDARLVFATVAEEGDALLTLTADRKDNFWMRLDGVANVAEGTSLQAHGERLIKTEIERYVNLDVLPADTVMRLESENGKKKKLLDAAGDQPGMSFAPHDHNKIYGLLTAWHVDPLRDIYG